MLRIINLKTSLFTAILYKLYHSSSLRYWPWAQRKKGDTEYCESNCTTPLMRAEMAAEQERLFGMCTFLCFVLSLDFSLSPLVFTKTSPWCQTFHVPFDELIPAANTNADKVLRGDREVVTSIVPFSLTFMYFSRFGIFLPKEIARWDLCQLSQKSLLSLFCWLQHHNRKLKEIEL